MVGNDVQVATDAEFKLGAGRLYGSLLGVFWGTGVGGGLILDGRPWTGRGGAGEIGHVVVVINGARCTCGRLGCMEAYAGRGSMEAYVRELHEQKGRKTDLFKLMKEHNRTRLTSGIWQRALEHGDKLATHTIDRAIEALGAGVASVINVLDVEGIVIGGGLGVRLGDPYVSASTMRCSHICSMTRIHRACTWRSWATSAAPSVPRSWSAIQPRPERRRAPSRAPEPQRSEAGEA